MITKQIREEGGRLKHLFYTNRLCQFTRKMSLVIKELEAHRPPDLFCQAAQLGKGTLTPLGNPRCVLLPSDLGSVQSPPLAWESISRGGSPLLTHGPAASVTQIPEQGATSKRMASFVPLPTTRGQPTIKCPRVSTAQKGDDSS